MAQKEKVGQISLKEGPWSEEVARRRAREDGVGELSEKHWEILHTLRAHFIQYGAMPPMSLACSMNHMSSDCVDRLFNGRQTASHIAGLPEAADTDLWQNLEA